MGNGTEQIQQQWQFAFESVVRLRGDVQATYDDLLELDSNHILVSWLFQNLIQCTDLSYPNAK